MLVSLGLCAACAIHLPCQDPVHFANGIKIGEVTPTTAIVWTRLTAVETWNRGGERFAQVPASEPQLPDGVALAGMRGAVPGAEGEVRLVLEAADGRRELPWRAVDPAANHTVRFELADLEPGSEYELRLEGRATEAEASSAVVEGRFRTAPAAGDPASVSFCVIGGQDWPRRDDEERGHRIYAEMLALAPDFAVHTGDTVYYDKAKPFANTVALARHKWNRFYALEWPRSLHLQVPCYFVKDDHDTLKNDCWPGQRYGELTFARGLELYREQLPVGTRPYRRVRWGRDLEVWFVEGREFRSPNRMEDGPKKTIWGEEQWAWVQRTMTASDATFRILLSPTPIVGPDRPSKNDNHANRGFSHEGDRVRAFLAGLDDAVVICGDRHWQYVSRDPATGLREFSCGASSDRHAGGFREQDRSDMHEFLKVKGGFLHVRCERDGEGPRLILAHRGVDGAVRHQVAIRPE